MKFLASRYILIAVSCTIAIAAGVLAITAAVYAISAVISTKLYQKREL